MMLTPNGQCAKKVEKVMLLTMWAYALDEQGTKPSSMSKKLIFAGIGKPTYPINPHVISSYLSYWENIKKLSEKWHLNPEETDDSPAIGYGDPHGDILPRTLMANFMTTWYQSEIKPEHVLFTIGGVGALKIIFETLNARYEEIPGYRIITPFPHYGAYANNQHCLHAVDVMSESGYKLTAKALEKSIRDAYVLAETDHGKPAAVLICNPSNPLGNIIDKKELIKIAAVLRCYPDLLIILDEAYAEMCFVDMPSFLKIAPDLKNRVILLRSATKALSAAGERMAVLLAFDHKLMSEMVAKSINYFVHVPRSSQMVYAQTMMNFNFDEHLHLVQFYQKKVDYVLRRLQAMGAEMPDDCYKVEATFYALSDFTDLLGLTLPQQTYQVLQRKGKVETDEDVAYYLLFKDLLMVAPLSYFGLSKDVVYLRITCSGNSKELEELMNRLERRLLSARRAMKAQRLTYIQRHLPAVKDLDTHLYEIISQKTLILKNLEENCLTLKATNRTLSLLQSMIENIVTLQVRHPDPKRRRGGRISN